MEVRSESVHPCQACRPRAALLNCGERLPMHTSCSAISSGESPIDIVDLLQDETRSGGRDADVFETRAEVPSRVRLRWCERAGRIVREERVGEECQPPQNRTCTAGTKTRATCGWGK